MILFVIDIKKIKILKITFNVIYHSKECYSSYYNIAAINSYRTRKKIV